MVGARVLCRSCALGALALASDDDAGDHAREAERENDGRKSWRLCSSKCSRLRKGHDDRDTVDACLADDAVAGEANVANLGPDDGLRSAPRPCR